MRETSEGEERWLGITELEEALRGPDKLDVAKKAISQLVACEDRLRGAMDKGMPPDEYGAAQVLMKALHNARAIISTYSSVIK